MTMETETSIPKRGFFSLIWGMIRHPLGTLQYLRDQGGRLWLLVALIAVVMTILPIAFSAPITSRLAQEAFQTQLDRMEQEGASQNFTPEMQGQVSQFATNPLFTVVFPSFTGLIGLVLGWLIWAGALHLLSVMIGGNSQFSRMWAAVIWASIPFVLRNLLQSVYILVSGQTISNPGLSGLVADTRSVSELISAPPSASLLALQTFLGQIDIFTLWNLALLVAGVIVMARLSRRKAILVTVGIWIIFLAFRILLAASSSIFASGIA
jgi:hypothetical protein